jgi:hypothetical protein
VGECVRGRTGHGRRCTGERRDLAARATHLSPGARSNNDSSDARSRLQFRPHLMERDYR